MQLMPSRSTSPNQWVFPCYDDGGLDRSPLTHSTDLGDMIHALQADREFENLCRLFFKTLPEEAADFYPVIADIFLCLPKELLEQHGFGKIEPRTIAHNNRLLSQLLMLAQKYAKDLIDALHKDKEFLNPHTSLTKNWSTQTSHPLEQLIFLVAKANVNERTFYDRFFALNYKYQGNLTNALELLNALDKNEDFRNLCLLFVETLPKELAEIERIFFPAIDYILSYLPKEILAKSGLEEKSILTIVYNKNLLISLLLSAEAYGDDLIESFENKKVYDLALLFVRKPPTNISDIAKVFCPVIEHILAYFPVELLIENGFEEQNPVVIAHNKELLFRLFVLAHDYSAHQASTRLPKVDDRALCPQIVEELHFQNCGLFCLPNFLWEYTNLRSLDLSGNRFFHFGLPRGELQQLRILNLSFNPLRTPPKAIGYLPLVKTLSLAGTNLMQLPKTLPALRFLETLDISHNPLSSISRTIMRLPSLTKLGIEGLPLEQADEQIEKIKQACPHITIARSKEELA